MVPFFANRSAVSFPCIPTCEGTHKGYCLVVSVEEFYCSCFFYYLSCGMFEATVWMADLESTRRRAFLKAVGLWSNCCSAMAVAVISPSKLVLLLPTEMWWENSSEWIPAPAFLSIFDNDLSV